MSFQGLRIEVVNVQATLQASAPQMSLEDLCDALRESLVDHASTLRVSLAGLSIVQLLAGLVIEQNDVA